MKTAPVALSGSASDRRPSRKVSPKGSWQVFSSATPTAGYGARKLMLMAGVRKGDFSSRLQLEVFEKNGVTNRDTALSTLKA